LVRHSRKFRDALIHRIPLYIPPFGVVTKNLARHQEIERLLLDAIEHHDWSDHKRLTDERKTLRSFNPWMTHSFEENADHIAFHPQMLADFHTIEEIG
jgi:hypothetical protein